MAQDARQAVALDGVAYTVTRLGRRAGRIVLRCEPPLGAPIPDYASRVRVRARLHPHATVVFTDAARSAEVWCRAGHERIRWPGQPEPSFPTRSRAGSPAVPATLLRMARAADGGADPFAVLHAALTDPAGPDALRAVWRCAGRIRVLDPDAGAGDWLIEVQEALEWVWGACLEQMSVWLGEVALGRERRRPEYLRDFRAAIGRPGSARETILLRSLYGVTGSARGAAVCRRRLARRAALPPACVRVRSGDPALGFASPAALPPDLAEEVESLARSEALAEGPEMPALEARRALLRRRLDSLAGRRALHPVLEWPARFHLVRGDEP